MGLKNTETRRGHSNAEMQNILNAVKSSSFYLEEEAAAQFEGIMQRRHMLIVRVKHKLSDERWIALRTSRPFVQDGKFSCILHPSRTDVQFGCVEVEGGDDSNTAVLVLVRLEAPNRALEQLSGVFRVLAEHGIKFGCHVYGDAEAYTRDMMELREVVEEIERAAPPSGIPV